ncbi:response regulator transcription factor [Polaromonas sp. JS666]|uniref:LuxR C-terminal-related transcriptional regulator n=1 Tax=Polaromonas sp. (strain JS666 / ATCC BAA-500) TaxID=296591 RepID=UPI00088430E3|nr:response regulator transcription factor [Polaromonas sp. JS666]SDN94034.1 DNA-binding response regulator, NarL/FixJ family, contains REC and HTH domains [Polaromonas sp. JS666]
MLNSLRIGVQVFCSDPLVRTGLKAAFGEEPDLAWVPQGEANADVVVADYERGLQLIDEAKAEGSASPYRQKVLILTARESEWEIRTALERGARGYLVHGCDLPELMVAVRTVHRGMRHLCAPAARRLADSMAHATLTNREVEVLRLVVEGCGNKVIARELDIAVGTVKSHLKTIFEKLGAKSRTEVAKLAERRGLLSSSPADVAASPRVATSA